MNEELLKLYYDYSINGKIADKDYIVKFISIISNYFNFSKYLTSILFVSSEDNTDNKVLASYDLNIKKIIYYSDIVDEIVKNNYGYERLVSKKEQIFYKNAIISTILLHELEHISQIKNMLEASNIESDILRLSRLVKTGDNETYNRNKMNESIQTYNMFYEFAPEERLAEINAHTDMYRIIEPIKNLVPNVVKTEEILALKNRLKGYKYESKLISPTIFYLHSLGKKKDLEKRPWYDVSLKVATKKSQELFELDKRLELGLPINHLEYFQTERQLKRLSKKL